MEQVHSFFIILMWSYCLMVALILGHVKFLTSSQGAYHQRQADDFKSLFAQDSNLKLWFNPMLLLKMCEIVVSQQVMLFKTYLLFKEAEGNFSRNFNKIKYLHKYEHLIPVTKYQKNLQILASNCLQAISSLEFCKKELGYHSKHLKSFNLEKKQVLEKYKSLSSSASCDTISS